MAFFGFDTPGHNSKAPGFSQAHDPFASFARATHTGDAIDFEDTYDGLGDELDETGDAFNNDTFGGEINRIGAVRPVGTDFDFFGATAKVADAMEEENVRYNRHLPTTSRKTPQFVHPTALDAYSSAAFTNDLNQTSQQPFRTGYEKYKESEKMPDLSVDRSLWGMEQKSAAPAFVSTPPMASSRKVLSLEEVEAQLRANSRKAAPLPMVSEPQFPLSTQLSGISFLKSPLNIPPSSSPNEGNQRPDPAQPFPGHSGPIKILERPQSHAHKSSRSGAILPPHPHPSQPTGILSEALAPQYSPQPPPAVVPIQILRNPSRLSGDAARLVESTKPDHWPSDLMPRSTVAAELTFGSQLPHPFQLEFYRHRESNLSQMSEHETAAFLELEMRRAKRNYKIFQLSKDNGLMTPQDKNFITRIQLQQLVVATGNPIGHGTDAALPEDFYYQVYSQIRSSQRQNPGQPLNNFAQTYLYQTGNRLAGRRLGRQAENHVQRLEQQVQRAVEAAKNKPKNPHLVIAGSLGKISFSNAKTPKPLLSIKRTDSSAETARASNAARQEDPTLDRKVVLRNIEKVYDTLMRVEDHGRSVPAVTPEEGEDEEAWQRMQVEWLATADRLNARLWEELKVHEPIGATEVHPFIAFLSFPKGKKAMPRVFRYMSYEQRTTVLTMIIFHLDQLDVTRGALVEAEAGGVELNSAVRERVELFSMTVMPCLFSYFNETGLEIVDGVLMLITSRLDVDLVAKTRVGASILTMILSRVELLKQGAGPDPQQWSKWDQTFNSFFNIIEPSLPHVFHGSVNSGEDVVAWQLLAAIGVSASPEQQQRLVISVKDRVLDTVTQARSLPPTLAAQRLSHVNLFMRSIGLDVELLQ